MSTPTPSRQASFNNTHTTPTRAHFQNNQRHSNTHAQNHVSTLPPLTSLLDSVVSLKLVDGHAEPIVGRIYTVDLVTGYIILLTLSSLGSKSHASSSDDEWDVQMINISAVQTYFLFPPSAPEFRLHMGTASLPDIQPHDVLQLSTNMEGASRAAQTIGVDVAPETQKLFNQISKIMPIKWRETDMIVMDEVLIKAPYTPEACVSLQETAKSGQTLNRVKQVVAAAR